MTAAIVDTENSILKWFRSNWTATKIAFPGADFDSKEERHWISVMILSQVGRTTRSSDYGTGVLISVNLFHRESQRKVMRDAQTLEGLLRASSITIYDEDDGSTVLGYLRLHEPTIKAARERDGLYIVTLDVDGLLLM